MGEDLYDIFFQVYVDADIMDAKRNLMQTYQAGIGMGNRDYYFESSDKMIKIQAEYLNHIQKMFQLAGFTTVQASEAAQAVMMIERQLALAHFSQAELRDSYANYHLYTTDSLKASFPGFCWDTYFETLGCADLKELSVSQEEPIRKSIEIMNTARIEDLRYYMQWRVLSAASSYMSDEFVTERFNFFGRVMSGRTEETPRWKRAVSMVDGSLGMALGKLYCEKYFPAEAKTRMETLCANLLKAYGERIDNLEWMSDETKAKAHEKLSTFYVKVGYPNKWEDYTALEIDSVESYWTLVKRVSKFNTARSMAKLSKPVDKDEWYMNPQTVNAYYNPTTNEICFPAGILQYPFFDMEADDAFNYGAIGVVIAHEVTHGFDDMGSNFDKDGNYANWWTEEDKARFNERTKVMEEYFNGIKVNETMYANGKMSLGENIADHGGLQVAFHAFKNATKENPLPVKDGFTPEQRFFLAYANVWAGNITEEEIVNRTLTDVHSLGKWRVNGALPHIAAWYEAFGITENDALYLAPEKRVSIW
jgi:putative endopeptidase